MNIYYLIIVMGKLDDMKLTVLYIEYKKFFIDILSRFIISKNVMCIIIVRF